MRIKERPVRHFNNVVDQAPSMAGEESTTMSREITLDVRGMEAPEPLERVLETIDDFGPGDKLRLIIDCRPGPLFRILERNGYACREAPGRDSNYEITIWRKP